VRHFKRFGVLSLAVASALLLAPTAAFAAPPSNDTFPGAVPIATVPFDVTVDTSEATTDADDAATNPDCGAPATDASVWYSITPTADTAYLVDVSASSYTAGVTVVTGTPATGFTLVTCGPSSIAFTATAGTTYYLLAFDDQEDAVGNGGTLRLHVEETAPPPTIDLTVKKTGTFVKKTGVATLSGTVTCSGQSDFAFVDGELRQPVGRAIVIGYFSFEVTCDGVTRKWTNEVLPYYPGTKFGGGNSAAMTYAVACGQFFCSENYQEHAVRLRRA
jgi:hypothetical protein